MSLHKIRRYMYDSHKIFDHFKQLPTEKRLIDVERIERLHRVDVDFFPISIVSTSIQRILSRRVLFSASSLSILKSAKISENSRRGTFTLIITQ